MKTLSVMFALIFAVAAGAWAEGSVELGEPTCSTNLVTSTPVKILSAHSGAPARVSIGISNFGTTGVFAWGGTNTTFSGGYYIPAGQTLFITFPSHLDNRSWYAATLSGTGSVAVVEEKRTPN